MKGPVICVAVGSLPCVHCHDHEEEKAAVLSSHEAVMVSVSVW